MGFGNFSVGGYLNFFGGFSQICVVSLSVDVATQIGEPWPNEFIFILTNIADLLNLRQLAVI